MKDNAKTLIIGGVEITNPDKMIFKSPPVTKAVIVRYFEKAAKRMIPYMGNRILSIVRCPKGIEASCFYKKHPGPDNKGINPIEITESDGEQAVYFYISDKYGLLCEAQMGTVEFHAWGSQVEYHEKPDMMVFDLDPDTGMELKKVREGVKDLKNVLDSLSLKSYLKTSGAKAIMW